MKKIATTLFMIMTVHSNAAHLTNLAGRIFVVPTQVEKVNIEKNQELEVYCSMTSQYLETFRERYEDYECLSSNPRREICKTIDRIYKRVADAPGALGTDLPKEVALELSEIKLVQLNRSELLQELSIEEDQLVTVDKYQYLELTQIDSVVTHHTKEVGNFLFALEALKRDSTPKRKDNTIIFSDRLSACAFNTGETKIQAIASLDFEAHDKTPQKVMAFLNHLTHNLEEVFYKHMDLSDPSIAPHQRAYSLMRFGIELADLKEEIKDDEIFRLFFKVAPMKDIHFWWNNFFQTNEMNQSITFKRPHSNDLKRLYKEETFTISNSIEFEIIKGEN